MKISLIQVEVANSVICIIKKVVCFPKATLMLVFLNLLNLRDRFHFGME